MTARPAQVVAGAIGMVLLAGAGAGAAAQAPDPITVHCSVFDDGNGDGIRQAGEPGLPGIRITNGVSLHPTDANGDVTVIVDRASYRFATLSVPAGRWPTTAWYAWVPVGTAGPVQASFGLKSFPETAADPIHWVHISDTQTQSWGQPPDVYEDIAQINELPGSPLFCINTGDLVEVGSDTTQWNHYLDQVSTASMPVFHVPGNHDTLGTGPVLDNYERFVGPPYYSFQAGSWTFLFYNSERPTLATPRQTEWLDAVIADAPPGSRPILFQHRMLAGQSTASVSALAARGVLASFSGHWHALQISRHLTGIVDYNLSRTSQGPLDRTPRSFAVVHLQGDGTIDYSLRRLAVDHRSVITHPAPSQTCGGPWLEVMAQLYDTSSPVASATASVTGPGGGAGPTTLVQEGISLWRTLVDVGALPDGDYDVSVTGTFEDGRSFDVRQPFTRALTVPIVRSPSGDWPMFRKSAAGSSFTATEVAPPLEMAWSTPTPGMVALSSPVVAAGRVYLGCRPESGDLDTGGILCCDAASGNALWYSPVPGGVALAPAVADNLVLVTTMADSAIALDAATGARVWGIRTPGNKYKMTAPVFDGADAWVGSEPTPQAIDRALGTARWTTAPLGSSWYPAIYSAPAVGPQLLYFSFYGTPGLVPDGFSIVDRASGATVYLENGSFRSPIVTPEAVYVIGDLRLESQRLTARNPDGTVQWTAATDFSRSTGAPALGHGVLVAAGRNGTIEGIRVTDGASLWSHAVGPSLYDMSPNRRNQRDTVGAPAITDSVVYVGSLDGNLYALDLATGAELWSWHFGTPMASSPAASGNMVFVGASDGHLYAFASDGRNTGVPEPGAGGRASVFAFYPPRPNPSDRTVRLEWVLPAPGRVRVDIHDLAGRRIAKLLDEDRDAGEGGLAWDGRDRDGRPVSAGIYFARVRTPEGTAVRKLVRLRR